MDSFPPRVHSVIQEGMHRQAYHSDIPLLSLHLHPAISYEGELPPYLHETWKGILELRELPLLVGEGSAIFHVSFCEDTIVVLEFLSIEQVGRAHFFQLLLQGLRGSCARDERVGESKHNTLAASVSSSVSRPHWWIFKLSYIHVNPFITEFHFSTFFLSLATVGCTTHFADIIEYISALLTELVEIPPPDVDARIRRAHTTLQSWQRSLEEGHFFCFRFLNFRAVQQ